ncbi:MAG: sulfatase-like hydrolase/transferase, partial [Planctomycetaceae bacterium]|nr:sulfatase-like hydrolase/transferase [Planctomycetaceae bacterium]
EQSGTVELWYCSDNGEPSNSWYRPMLNGCKGNLFEGGIRVPAIIEWPAGIPQPGNTSMNCVTSDMLPTICDLLDLPLPNRVLDGISLVPLLQGDMKERPHPICFWRYGASAEEANGPWMSPESQLGTTPTAGNPATQFMNYRHPVAKTEFGGDAAIIDGRYKLIVDTTGRHRNPGDVQTPMEGDIALFDLVDDTTETENIAAAHPELVAKMMKQLRIWEASVEQSLTGSEY